MIVEARVKKTNIDSKRSRIDVFNPRFKFKPLLSLPTKHAGKKVFFFTEWKDLATHKCMTVNGTRLPKEQMGGNLSRGMVFCCGDHCDCCEGENKVFIYMPERLIT